jgi:hypothetical protein
MRRVCTINIEKTEVLFLGELTTIISNIDIIPEDHIISTDGCIIAVYYLMDSNKPCNVAGYLCDETEEFIALYVLADEDLRSDDLTVKDVEIQILPKRSITTIGVLTEEDIDRVLDGIEIMAETSKSNQNNMLYG